MSFDKTKALYAVGIGLILSDIIPTPADALYFYRQRINKKKLETGEITPRQYWMRDAFGYYAYNPLWWSIVLGATISLGKSYEQKRNILIGLIAGGAVIGVIAKNIKEDEKLYAKINGNSKVA